MNSPLRTLLAATLLLCLISLPKISSAQYPSIFWEISGNGLEEPSHLLGTMHVKDIRVFQQPDSVWLALANADRVVLESDPDDWTRYFFGEMGYSGMREQYYELYTGEPNAGERLDYFSINRSFGPDGKFFKWMVKFLAKDFEQKEVVLDSWIWNFAQANEIEFSALELMSDYDGYDSIQSPMIAYGFYADPEEMVKRYKSHDLDVLLVPFKMEGSDSMYVVHDTIMTLRNIKMANGIDTLVHMGKTFIGVGAAHLPSRFGVINLLREKGYTVRPVGKRYELPSPPELDFSVLPWYDFTPADSSFQISVPATMKIFQDKAMPALDGFYGTIDHNKDILYFVSRQESLANLKGQKFLPYFEALAEESGMRLLNFEKEKLADGSVVLEVELTNFMSHHYLYYHYDNHFTTTLGVLSPANRKDEDDRMRFVESFELLKTVGKPMSRAWEEVSLSSFGITVEMPAGAEQTFLSKEQLHGDQLAFSASSRDLANNMQYEIAINDGADFPADNARFLENFDQSIDRINGGELLADTAYLDSTGIYVAEIEAKGSVLQIQRRAYRYGDRLLQLSALGNTKNFDSLAAGKFFNSLKWTRFDTATTYQWESFQDIDEPIVDLKLPSPLVRRAVTEYFDARKDFLITASPISTLKYDGREEDPINNASWLYDHIARIRYYNSLDTVNGLVYQVYVSKLYDYFQTDSSLQQVVRSFLQDAANEYDSLSMLQENEPLGGLSFSAYFHDTAHLVDARAAAVLANQYLVLLVVHGTSESLANPVVDQALKNFRIHQSDSVPAFDLAERKSLSLFKALESEVKRDREFAVEYFSEFPFGENDRNNLYLIIDSCHQFEVEEPLYLKCEAFEKWTELIDSTDLPLLENHLIFLDSMYCYTSDAAGAMLRIGTGKAREMYLDLLPRFTTYRDLHLPEYTDSTTQLDWLYPALTDELLARYLGNSLLEVHTNISLRDSIDAPLTPDFNSKMAYRIDSLIAKDEARGKRFEFSSDYYSPSHYTYLLPYIATLAENGKDTTGFFQRILALPSMELSYQTISTMIELGVEVPQAELEACLSDPFYHNLLYKVVDSSKVEQYLEPVSSQQKDFAVSDLCLQMTSTLEVEKLKLEGVIELEEDSLSGRVYAFSYKAYGRKWVFFSGPQPMDQDQFTLEGELTSTREKIFKRKMTLEEMLERHIEDARKRSTYESTYFEFDY